MASEEERMYALSNALSTPEGRHEVAQTILEPFKEGRDYVAIGRKLLFVDCVKWSTLNLTICLNTLRVLQYLSFVFVIKQM